MNVLCVHVSQNAAAGENQIAAAGAQIIGWTSSQRGEYLKKEMLLTDSRSFQGNTIENMHEGKILWSEDS